MNTRSGGTRFGPLLSSAWASVWLATAIVLPLPAAPARVVVVAGGGNNTNATKPLPGPELKLGSPFGVDFDAAGTLYLVEMTGQRVRKMGMNGRMEILAGTGAQGQAGDGGPARRAEFNGPHNLAVSQAGDLFIADTWNNRVRRIDGATGRIQTVAGTGEKGFSGDGGPATLARFGGIYCVSLTPDGSELLLADLDNLRIRAVHLASGLVRTVAGNGNGGVPAEGASALHSPLVDPRAVIGDREGRVYVLERGGHALRRVDRDGTVHTVVGGSGKAGASGDGGPALAATLNGPKHLCLDRDGGILIADTENHLIRKYTPTDGRIVRVAGTGRPGTAGLEGPPLQAELNQPHGVTVRGDGTLFISDSSNHRVLGIERGRR